MQKIISFILFLLMPVSAFAHAKGVVSGFSEGLMHPVSGSDHLLAMVSVGIISAQMGGRAVWSVPSIFVAFMAIGGILGLYNINFIAVESGISASVILLGFMIIFDSKTLKYLAHLLIAFFASFHGDAHGLEMPDLATSGLYMFGFLLTTIILHITGLGIGFAALKSKHSKKILKAIGAVVVVLGILF